MSKYRIKKVVNKDGVESFYVQKKHLFTWWCFAGDGGSLFNPVEKKFNSRLECLCFIQKNQSKEVISYEYC